MQFPKIRMAQALAGLTVLAVISLAVFAAAQPPPPAPPPGVYCSRFNVGKSTANDGTGVHLPWRLDLPTAPGSATHAWESKPLSDWQGYMGAVLSEVRASGVRYAGQRVTMNANAEWWIAPWMDYGPNGRERNNGLTSERGPDAGDLSPTSTKGLQVWAVGFYNREGASALAAAFADPCNPQIPSPGMAFPAKTASFKLLFTNAGPPSVGYLAGAPTIKAYIDPAPPGKVRTEQDVRLLQMDIAVRDPRSPTGWVFGTYVWKGPATGDGLLDNLVPVGLIWGNDPDASADPRDAFATLTQTHLNPALAGVVWRGVGQTWPERPWPGFQGRLNGPADNLRSSCLSCHALAQWPRSALGIVPTPPTYSLTALNSQAVRDKLRTKYLTNVPAGQLTVPGEAPPAKSLDYSLQMEAALTRMCTACGKGDMTGPTPPVCQVPGLRVRVKDATCHAPNPLMHLFSPTPAEPPPRQ